MLICKSIRYKCSKAEVRGMEARKYTKEEAIKAAKKSLQQKKEVIRWMKSGEPYDVLAGKGITLGQVGK